MGICTSGGEKKWSFIVHSTTKCMGLFGDDISHQLQDGVSDTSQDEEDMSMGNTSPQDKTRTYQTCQDSQNHQKLLTQKQSTQLICMKPRTVMKLIRMQVK